jgi:excisionase family DNA binding protein
MTAKLDDLPPVLRVAEVASVLRIGRNAAYALVASGDLPSIRVGRSVRVTRASLAIFLDPSGYARALQERIAPGSTRVTSPVADGSMTPEELFAHLGEKS